MYENVVLIEKGKHAELRFRKPESVAFAQKQTFAAVTAPELFSAVRSQPVLFAKYNDEIFPCALMGIRPDENLFINSSGQWINTEYCPFFIRRYPFIHIKTGDKTSLGYDENCGCVGEESGDRIFDENGEQTDFTKNLMKMMGKYQTDAAATGIFVNTLHKLDLLEGVKSRVRIGVRSYTFDSLLKVSEEKLSGLDSSIKLDLVQNGFYNLIIAHLISLNNFEKLAAMAVNRDKKSL